MFIEEPAPSPARQAFYDEDVKDEGYVMNLTRAWAWVPKMSDGLFDLLDEAARVGDLSYRDKAILVTSMASTLGDAYCSIAWGARLAGVTNPDTAVAVINRQPNSSMTVRDLALASWANKLVADPNSTTQADVEGLRQAGMSDQQIMAATVYVSLRLAFSTVNDAIGVAPDQEIEAEAPPEVVSAIDFGRSTAQTLSADR